MNGMQEALERDSSIARADCALPFAVRVLQELVALHSENHLPAQRGAERGTQRDQDCLPAAAEASSLAASRTAGKAPAARTALPHESAETEKQREAEPQRLAEAQSVAEAQIMAEAQSVSPAAAPARCAPAAGEGGAPETDRETDRGADRGADRETDRETQRETDGGDAEASLVASWLRSAGLAEHASKFAEERIDMLSLGMLSEVRVALS